MGRLTGGPDVRVDTNLAAVTSDMSVALVKDRRGRAWLSCTEDAPVRLTLEDAQALTRWLAQWITEQPAPGEDRD